MSLPITLAMFTSTKGHYDKDTYPTTVKYLETIKHPPFFRKMVAHIKYEGTKDAYKRVAMNGFFRQHSFDVIENEGQWKHNDNSHYVEHSKDICRLMQSSQVQSNPYVFWIEDDVILKAPEGFEHVKARIVQAMDYLDKHPEKMCVRVLDREDILPSLLISDKGDDLIFPHLDCFSFRANVMRSRDAWTLGSFFKNNFPTVQGIHIERYATEVLRAISGDGVPFACFHLDKLRHIHIGSQEFDPLKEY